jgi:hypothetical protein
MTADKIRVRQIAAKDNISTLRGVDEIKQVLVIERLFEHPLDAKLGGPSYYGW